MRHRNRHLMPDRRRQPQPVQRLIGMTAATIVGRMSWPWLLAIGSGALLVGALARTARSAKRVGDYAPTHPHQSAEPSAAKDRPLETLVTVASEDSFPASDSPAYAKGRGRPQPTAS